MNHLRQQGYLRYSRKGIQLDVEALRGHLRAATGQGVTPAPGEDPPAAGAARHRSVAH